MRSSSPRLTQGCDYGWGRETPQNYVGLRNRFLARTGAGIGTTCRPSLFSYYWQSSERLQICSKTSGIEHEKEPDSAWHTLWNSQQAIIDNNFRRSDSIFTISTSPASKLLLASNPKGTECLGFDKHSKATSQHSLINNNCCHKIHRCKFSFLSFLQIPSQKLADMGMNTAERPRSWILERKKKNHPIASRPEFSLKHPEPSSFIGLKGQWPRSICWRWERSGIRWWGRVCTTSYQYVRKWTRISESRAIKRRSFMAARDAVVLLTQTESSTRKDAPPRTPLDRLLHGNIRRRGGKGN